MMDSRELYEYLSENALDQRFEERFPAFPHVMHEFEEGQI